MHRLNSKGTTLTELIISVALLAIVIVFMFRLIVDLHNEQVNDNFASDNQISRSEIIKFIESDLSRISNKLVNINSDGSTRETLMIKFKYKNDKEATLSVTQDTLEYTNSSGETRKWSAKNCSFYVDKANVYFNKDNNIFSMNLVIEVHTNNDLNTVRNNNTLDDISIPYIGYNGSITDQNCLGYECN